MSTASVGTEVVFFNTFVTLLCRPWNDIESYEELNIGRLTIIFQLHTRFCAFTGESVSLSIPVYLVPYFLHICFLLLTMRRASESSLFSLVFKGNKLFYNGSYEHRVPKIKHKSLLCTRDVCVCDSTSQLAT